MTNLSALNGLLPSVASFSEGFENNVGETAPAKLVRIANVGILSEYALIEMVIPREGKEGQEKAKSVLC
ncbi:hypothetical protein EGR_10257 [Echinococcus granulosus]|uniref:Uncharacterized protein n=1 Tax=Echinococcus granulosus TaxID=6210 RepID=W6U8Q7_ECHGR|nr:hypothetical protein EGR_10257 [Echinococcus granulosus]EUB54882.1 hypothetical protein EGR_10257 [Echinococcus granulosus]